MQEIVVPLQPGPSAERAPRAVAVPSAVRSAVSPPATPEELALWTLTVACSADACLVVDVAGAVVALSPSLARLVDRPVEECLGRGLVTEVLDLLPFSADGGGSPGYAERVPPLWAVQTDAPARSLLRVRRQRDLPATFDVVAAPLHGGDGQVLGAVAFFSPLD